MQQALAVGIMSGTSLDGLDLVLVRFTFKNKWNFGILKSTTIGYNNVWVDKLSKAYKLDGYELLELHKNYGRYIGNHVNDFLTNIPEPVDFIASHGHTVFHRPDKGITLQIGDGQEIATKTNITTICDFRAKDVTLGGQGAPLVPIGDKLLFSDYDYCINIGGFANISFDSYGKRVAYDICPANIILNHLSNSIGHAYDKNGEISSKGNFNHQLFNELNSISYYQKPYPKSLGREWLENNFFSIINKYSIPAEDKLNTVSQHIAFQISRSINNKKGKVLVTGGGAYNTFILDLIKQSSDNQVDIPSKTIIEYKEAIIFAFLGLLRLTNQPNCLASVTGADRDSSGGVVFMP